MSNPMFQHRHYVAIAAVLADAREDEGGTHTPWQAAFDDMEDRLIRMFKADNYGFKPSRFRAAARRAPDMHERDKVL
jgi:hypothetical protein